MKRVTLLLAAMILVLSFSCVAFAEEDWTGNVNFFVGSKSMEETDWAPVEDQGEFGIELDFGKKSWPFNIAIDIMSSSKEEEFGALTLKGETHELNLGVRKIFDLGGPKPFIGGGLSIISAKASATVGPLTGSADYGGTGLWIAGGIYFTLGESFNLGLEFKHSAAKDEVVSGGNSYDIELGGSHAGLILGVHW